jgi:hypothetical protein
VTASSSSSSSSSGSKSSTRLLLFKSILSLLLNPARRWRSFAGEINAFYLHRQHRSASAEPGFSTRTAHSGRRRCCRPQVPLPRFITGNGGTAPSRLPPIHPDARTSSTIGKRKLSWGNGAKQCVPRWFRRIGEAMCWYPQLLLAQLSGNGGTCRCQSVIVPTEAETGTYMLLRATLRSTASPSNA